MPLKDLQVPGVPELLASVTVVLKRRTMCRSVSVPHRIPAPGPKAVSGQTSFFKAFDCSLTCPLQP